LWYHLTEVVFPDYSGDTALWAYLDFLFDWEVGYNWGSAGLTYLYRSLRSYLNIRLWMHVCFFELCHLIMNWRM
jgi:hypothetical protein